MVQNPPCRRASSLLFPHWDIKTKPSHARLVDWGPFVLTSQCGNNNELSLAHGGFCTTWSFVAKGLFSSIRKLVFLLITGKICLVKGRHKIQNTRLVDFFTKFSLNFCIINIIFTLYSKHEKQCFIGYQTPRREMKVWRAAKYFWRNSRCLDNWWNTV